MSCFTEAFIRFEALGIWWIDDLSYCAYSTMSANSELPLMFTSLATILPVMGLI